FLELEITESAVMENPEQAVALLRDIRQLGITIAIDDFGTGYSSLAYLKKFPVNSIKIDQSFIADLIKDSDDAAIVESIIQMARSLGLEVVAEGVETLEQLEFLRERNCHEAQGYYFSKPLPPEQFAKKILSRKAE
uniref:EAL domain-containing protein n=1 Tax=Candidatus Electronema sp. TaxID=2698783 RepID=UPI00405726F3